MDARTRIGSLRHLAARFFDVISARPLGDSERAWVRVRLDDGTLPLFFAQAPADQRHGFESGARVESTLPDRPDLVRAALLHDVGKRHARLGVLGRVLASLAMLLGLSLRGRFAVYRDHGPIAAIELRELGVEPVVWRFAATHHGTPDPAIPPADWEVLEEADGARGPGKPGRR